MGEGCWSHSLGAGLSPTLGGLSAAFQREAGQASWSFGTFLRASLLRPKRPTGLILRPVYQAGSMSGPEKRVRAVTDVCPRRVPCVPPEPG